MNEVSGQKVSQTKCIHIEFLIKKVPSQLQKHVDNVERILECFPSDLLYQKMFQKNVKFCPSCENILHFILQHN